jgi:hypothetical protein
MTSPSHPTWQQRFNLSVCPAADAGRSIPDNVIGIAVIYSVSDAGEQIYLVLESRAGALRERCARRLETAGLPPVGDLLIAFGGDARPEESPEALNEACRKQVLVAEQLRRELRPAMR